MIAIIDYGMGNLFSVKKILEQLQVQNLITQNAEQILKADKLIIPGVGSFKSAMQNLADLNLIEVLNESRNQMKPIWGICLGMQLMCNQSTEGGLTKGLNWFDMSVDKFNLPNDHKVPHIGWNNILVNQNCDLFRSFLNNPTFYFSHSYIVNAKHQANILATCEYGINFPAVIQNQNLLGTQFHPEKSQIHGRILIENFLNWRV